MQAVEKCVCYGPKECLFLLEKIYRQIPQNRQIYSHMEDYICTQLLDDPLILYFDSFFIETN